mgnify:CR=1 FL=1
MWKHFSTLCWKIILHNTKRNWKLPFCNPLFINKICKLLWINRLREVFLDSYDISFGHDFSFPYLTNYIPITISRVQHCYTILTDKFIFFANKLFIKWNDYYTRSGQNQLWRWWYRHAGFFWKKWWRSREHYD